ncbi:transcription factor IIIB 60 kDa subunit-like protein isoform X1 [Tanacetum coccineum]
MNTTNVAETGLVIGADLQLKDGNMRNLNLLIAFSSELGVSIYELGIVYLQLCQLLSLHNHPFVQKPVDSSLYMHRYTSVMVKCKSAKIPRSCEQDFEDRYGTDSGILLESKKRYKDNVCAICYKKFRSAQALGSHKRVHNKADKKVWVSTAVMWSSS